MIQLPRALGLLGGLLLLLTLGCADRRPVAAPAGSAAPPSGAQPAPAGPPAADSAAASPPTHLRFVFPGENFSSLPFQVGQTRGFYQRHGLEVETLTMPSVTAVAALVAGDLDAIGSAGSSVKAAVAGHPIKLVFATAHTQLFDLIARPEIQRPEQLRGKIISASEAGGTQDLATLAALAHFGLAEHDVQYLRSKVDNAMRLEQLRMGQVDAGAFNPPLNVQARREGMNLLVSTGDIYPLPLTGVAARVTSLSNPQERDVLVRFLKGSFAAMEWIRANRAEAVADMAAWLSYDRSLAEDTYDASLAGMSSDGTASDLAMRNAIQAALDPTDAPRTVTVDQVADWSLARQAVEAVRGGQ